MPELTEILPLAKEQYPVAQYRNELTALIAEIEACMGATTSSRDRESDFQHEAFRERCQQAILLAGRLAASGHAEWSLRSGDAHRIHESLKLSLDYFRRHTLA